MRQWKPVAGAGRTVHRGRTVGNAWDHPRAVCVVRYPLSGSGSYAPRGEAAIAARFVHGAAAHAFRKRTADAVELPSRSSTLVARKGAAVAAESAFEGRAVVAENGTGRQFAEK